VPSFFRLSRMFGFGLYSPKFAFQQFSHSPRVRGLFNRFSDPTYVSVRKPPKTRLVLKPSLTEAENKEPKLFDHKFPSLPPTPVSSDRAQIPQHSPLSPPDPRAPPGQPVFQSSHSADTTNPPFGDDRQRVLRLAPTFGKESHYSMLPPIKPPPPKIR